MSDAIVSNIPQQIDACILDVMEKIQHLHGKLHIFLRLFNCVPEGVDEVHFLADSYLLNSIKVAERKTRKRNWTVIIKSRKSKVPPDFQSFWKNDYNKIKIIELHLDCTINTKPKYLILQDVWKFIFPSINTAKVYLCLPLIFCISVASKKKQIREFFVTIITF